MGAEEEDESDHDECNFIEDEFDHDECNFIEDDEINPISEDEAGYHDDDWLLTLGLFLNFI